MKSSFFYLLFTITLAMAAGPTTEKIKLRDGTELEGTVSTTANDPSGFTFRTKYGMTHYDWNQLDLKELQKTNPELHQYMLQQAAIDQIQTDQQIILFLTGKFVFRSENNKLLKNYGTVLDQLAAAIHQKQAAKRSEQFTNLLQSNRQVLTAFDRRCLQLQSVTPTQSLKTILISYHNAFDALLRNDPATFIYNYTYAQQALGIGEQKK